MKTKNEILNLKKELQLKEELIAKLLLDVENSKSNNMADITDITDMESAEQELNKSDDKYKSVIQFLQEGIIIQDKNGYFTDANESALLILGISLEQLLGLTAFDPMWGAIKEDGSEFPVEEYPITLSFKEGIALNNIIMGIHKPNGELIWTTINSKPIINPLNNEIIGSVASFKDITHQKVINDDLDRNLKLLEESQSISKLGGWELDLITDNLYWTAETYKLHETIPEEFNPTVDAGVGYYLPESKVILVKALELATTLGTGYDLYLQTYTAKGRLIDVRTTCKVTMVDGKPIKLTGIFQDITEQKMGEEKQRKTDEKYKTVVATLQEGIAIHDENLSITEANKSAEEILGLTLDQMQGRTPVDESWKTIREDGSEFTSNTRLSMITLQTGKTLTNQIMGVYKPNGNLTWISINTVPMYGDGCDKPNGVLASFKDITEQKTLELNLKNEKEKYKLLFDNNPMPISIFDAETLQYLNVNEAFCEKYGYSLEEILKLTILDIRPEKEIDSFLNSLKPNVSGLINVGIYTHQKRNKEIIKVEIIGCEIIYEGRRAKLVLANDVTEKLKIEAELMLNKKAVESSLEGILISDANQPDFPLIYINDRFTELTGYTKEDAIGKNSRFLQGPDSAGETLDRLRKAIVEKNDFEGELINYKKDGTKFWNHLRITTIKNAKGKVTNHVFFQNDITIRKNNEMLLIEREKSLEDIFNFSPVPFVIAKISNGEIIMVNNSLVKLLGENANDLIGKFTHQFYVSKIDRNDILKEIEETGELNNIDLILKTTTGEEIECMTSSKKIKLNDEYVNLISFLDIRKIKETEMTLTKAKESAEEMSRLKSSFLANMSHELRTPMNGIIGFSDFMKSVDDIEEVKEISELIYLSAQRLMETLNLILDISTIESGVNKLVYNDLDIIQLIKDNIELFSKFANSKNLSLTLKSKYEEFIIKSNQKALYSILSNLISNAIKYTLKGGITIELDMISEDDKLSNNKKCVILKVHDTGIGIEEKYFTTIFEEFRQVSEGINRNFEGSGLGLTLIKKYVQVIGGEINVESEIDKGTTFTIKLPIEER